MEPLASLNGPAYSNPFSVPGESPRSGVETEVRGKDRPIELRPDRVDRNEATTAAGGGRPTQAGAEAEPGVRIGAGPGRNRDDPATRDPAERRPDLSQAGASPRRETVTYRVYPDLSISIQSRVIDREADETLRAVPPDQRIQLARRFQQFIGEQVDTLA